MDTTDVTRRQTTVLNADVVGYSRLMAQSDLRTVARLLDCIEHISALVRGFGGRVLDTTGDNLSAEFSSESAAVRCATLIQRMLADRDSASPEAPLTFRIGIHRGEALAVEKRVYGDVVNIAARLQQRATPGHVLVSEAVAERVSAQLTSALTDRGPQCLKNIPYAVRAFEAR